MSFTWDELRSRKIVQWALAYLAGAWVAYEVLSQVAENFAWPALVMRVATVLLLAGLLAVLVLAWYHGEQGRQRVGVIEIALLVGIAGVAALGSVWVARTAPAGGAGAPGAGAGPTVTGPGADDVLLNSIAVLPLANRSGDPSQDYFADGLTEELMGALARVPGLRLAARTSSFAFKDRSGIGLDSISKALNVRHVLDGSVRRQGDSVRISVALIDARYQYEIWQETYREAVADVFAVEESIARQVVEALPLDPVILEAEWSLVARPTSQEAFDLYLLGKEAWNRRTGEDLLRAIEFFEKAVAVDSRYAPAWAALAETYVVLPGYTTVSARTAYDRLRQTAGRALALDSTNVQAHTALGYGTVWYGRDFPTGIARLDRALELDPDYANALHWRGEVVAHAGRFEESWSNFELALEVDPLSNVTVADYGQALQLAGRHEEAVELLESLLDRAPGYLIGEYWLFYPSLLTGRYDRAEDLARSVARGVGLDPARLAMAVRGVAGDVDREAAIAALDAQPRSISGVGKVILTAMYAQLGAVDRAYGVIEQEAGTPIQTTIYLVTHPVMEPLRDDPRYAMHAAEIELR